MRPSLRRTPKQPRCEFCGIELADPMVAFMEHVDEVPSCKMRYEEWRENVRREAGGS